ncbi:MAG: leucine-rich repeat domain-containing protein, partial [Clostridia bacterium]|nr:leucine-rich repeat domain-containing protein [Clostridia bacterium]
MKLKKLLLTAMAVFLLLTTVCIVAVSASNETAAATDRDLKIYAKNLSLEDSVYLLYAVPVEGTEGADSVQMLFWLTPQNEYVNGTQDYTLSPEPATTTIGGNSYYVFEFRELAAKQMTVDVYARVYATDENGEYYSDLDKYSILQYAYNKLGKTSSTTPDEKTKNLLNNMLAYGAAAQEYFGENTNRLANASYYQIKVQNALLPDGTAQGLYTSGTQLSVTASETNTVGEVFLYWENSAGAVVSEELNYTITVSSQNETYTAVYGVIETPVIDPLVYTEQSDGTYSVKANPDVELPAAIAIPATYNEKAVTVIEENAFLDCTGLTSISLPYGIKTIGDKAFSGCTGLTAIDLPATVTTIGTRAFYSCTGISEITIPESVTSIGTQPFYKCDNLKTVYYNGQYGSQDNPFLNVQSIETVIFGGTWVPSYALYNRTYPITVVIDDNVKGIGIYAFHGCRNLTSITIPNSVTSIGNFAFQYCSSLTSITIPDSVTSIGHYAFNGCSSLTSIEIPDSVTSISFGAFYGCSSLTSITIPDSVTNIDGYVFEGCSGLTSITIPESVTSINIEAFKDCSSLTSITIPDSVTSIGEYAFYGCSSLTSITIPNSVISIDSYTFKGCSSLTSITIPESVMSIDTEAFYGCSSLTSITIPDSVTSIGWYAFYGC